MFVAVVRRARGTIIGVKLPPLSRYPWRTGAGEAAEKPPTISPALLMSCATVPSEPGTSIDVKLKVVAEAEEVRTKASASADTAVRIECIRFPLVAHPAYTMPYWLIRQQYSCHSPDVPVIKVNRGVLPVKV